MSIWQKGKKVFHSFISGVSQTFWKATQASASFSTDLECAPWSSCRLLRAESMLMEVRSHRLGLVVVYLYNFLQKRHSAEHLFPTGHVPIEAVLSRTGVSFLVWSCL